MHLGRFRTRALHEWVVLLMLPALALALRLLVPAGFMRSFGEIVVTASRMQAPLTAYVGAGPVQRFPRRLGAPVGRQRVAVARRRLPA
jgi:hypothetical protein